MKTITRMAGQTRLKEELPDSLAVEPSRRKAGFWKIFKRQKHLYMMSIPFVLLVIVFNYFPLWGWSMAFQNYRPGVPFWEQEWVGLQHFVQLFSDECFYLVLRNTLAMSLMSLGIGFVFPIMFAVLLNEVRLSFFKRTVQTITYMPHFVSWVVVAGIVTKMLSIDGGIFNELLMSWGIVDKPVQFMAKGEYFWSIVVLSDLWKEMGWNAIIFLAAIAGIDPQLYEAAKVDGAGRWRRIWHVTLPGIRPTILVLLILSIGHLTSIGFEKQFLLGNSLVVDYSEVLDLYALNYGIGLGRFSMRLAFLIRLSALFYYFWQMASSSGLGIKVSCKRGSRIVQNV